MSIAPLQVVNITAGGTDITDMMTALHDYVLSSASAWTVVHQTEIDTASPGPGSYSLAIRAPDGSREICLINEDTAAAPSLTRARLGLNPDGSESIADSAAPWNSATQFSGDSKLAMSKGWYLWEAVSPQFIWWEWTDAVCLANKSPARAYTPNAWHAGNVWVPPLESLATMGNVRFDGNGILASRPLAFASGSSGNEQYWLHRSTSQANGLPSFTEGSHQRIRIGTGQTTGTVDHDLSAGWQKWFASPTESQANDTEAVYDLGPNAEYHPTGWWRTFCNRTSQFQTAQTAQPTWLFMSRYALNVKSHPALARIQSDGKDVALVLSYLNLPSKLAMPIPNGFNVNP